METRGRIAIVMKGYPRLSETFIAQELLGLQDRGLAFDVWALRHPTDSLTHPMHAAIRAQVAYVPEYLHSEPMRVLRGCLAAIRRPSFGSLMRSFWRDLRRDPTRNRVRRLGQAMVLARELDPAIDHLHAHFLHTPASVTRYAALLSGRSWSFSAHAKDIWTSPDWEKREKLADAAWGVTCTAQGHRHLAGLAADPKRIELLYHGLDLARLPPAPASRPPRDGRDPADPVRIVCVGRAVEKKGLDDLLLALSALPPDLHWRFAHVGGGPLLEGLTARAAAAGLAGRTAFLGSRAQPEVLKSMAEGDLFVLPAKEGADGDRDGLPNVLMEAASQELAIVATRFAGIPEFVRDGIEGALVEPGAWDALSNAINSLARDPALRERLGRAAAMRLRLDFQSGHGLDRLAEKLGAPRLEQRLVARAAVAS